MQNIVAVILTFNEQLHIERSIRSLQIFVDKIIIIDSYSTDNTIEIARKYNVDIYSNKWVNYATQFNWALENCGIQGGWVWRVDADEYIDEELGRNVRLAIDSSERDITGVFVKRKIVFMGKPLMHGTWYPRWYLKVFKFGAGKCENRWMDEHIKLDYGKTISVEGNQIDDNLNDITWWTTKHNSYATREMIDSFFTQYELASASDVTPKFFGTDDQRLRWLKMRYLNMPLFVRPFFNFVYRYFLKMGFLDGKEGFIWHLLQGFWYRCLVDVKIYEMRKRFKNDNSAIIEYLKQTYL